MIISHKLLGNFQTSYLLFCVLERNDRQQFMNTWYLTVLIADTNVALGKRAMQNTVHYENLPGLALDGNKDNSLNGGSCAHTIWGENPWWSVDLGEEYVVPEVQITFWKSPSKYFTLH